MNTDTEFHIHHDAPEVVGRRERLGVRLLIVADGSFVFAMIFSYFYLRNLNANNGWLPKGAHYLQASSGWVVIIPLIIAAVVHRTAQKRRESFGVLSILTLIALLVGAYFQWRQISHMPFITHDTGVFEGSYASMWLLIASANLFHYLVGSFIALGLVLRARRVHLDPILETWRLRTAGSWFTWIAISGVACALTTTFIR
jgi:heme/copper-type cytochrome/quinol oxidase subunit 3